MRAFANKLPERTSVSGVRPGHAARRLVDHSLPDAFLLQRTIGNQALAANVAGGTGRRQIASFNGS